MTLYIRLNNFNSFESVFIHQIANRLGIQYYIKQDLVDLLEIWLDEENNYGVLTLVCDGTDIYRKRILLGNKQNKMQSLLKMKHC